MIMLECGEIERHEVLRRTCQQLDEAIVADLLIRVPAEETRIHDT
jgi:hypothetical protein